jgi:hypothetical protein
MVLDVCRRARVVETRGRRSKLIRKFNTIFGLENFGFLVSLTGTQKRLFSRRAVSRCRASAGHCRPVVGIRNVKQSTEPTKQKKLSRSPFFVSTFKPTAVMKRMLESRECWFFQTRLSRLHRRPDGDE